MKPPRHDFDEWCRMTIMRLAIAIAIAIVILVAAAVKSRADCVDLSAAGTARFDEERP